MNAPAKLGPLALLDAAPSGGPAFIEALRQRGRDAVAGSGLPGKRDEAWRFTSVLALTKVPFALAPTQAADVTSDAHVTLVDGVPHIAGQLPAGIEVTPLHAALAAAPADIESTLGSLGGTDFFAGLNAATLSDGVVVRIRREATPSTPLTLRYLTSAAAADLASSPRLLVLVDPGAEACLVEHHGGLRPEGAGRRLSNLVTEISLGERARLEHVVVHDSVDAHIARVAVRQAAASFFRSTVGSFGGALLRLDLHVLLDGEGAEAQLDGLYLVNGDEHVDHQIVVTHRAPRCSSRQTYRGVLDGRSSAVFDGTTIVEAGAQHTEGHQENRNLLLNDGAVIHTKPHLRIDADDVVCSHGATVGSLDREALFYLRSRGVPHTLAQGMLTYAFLRALVERVSHEPTRERLTDAILARLPEAEGLRESQ